MKGFDMDVNVLETEGIARETMACMVVCGAGTRMTMAEAAPYKTTGTYILERVVAFVQGTGCLHDDIMRSDQEAVVMSIIEEVGKIRATRAGGRFVVESLVGSSQSTGVSEKGCPVCAGQVRALKLAMEKRWSIKIPRRHSIIPWVVEYSAFLLNTCEVGHDGKTAHERVKGKRGKPPGVEFGEGVHWRSRQEEHWASWTRCWAMGCTSEARARRARSSSGYRWRVEDEDNPQDASGRQTDVHTRWHGGQGPGNHWKHDEEPDGKALPLLRMDPGAIDDARMQDSEQVSKDFEIRKSDVEAFKKKRVTFSEQWKLTGEDDPQDGTGAQSTGRFGLASPWRSEEQYQMEVR